MTILCFGEVLLRLSAPDRGLLFQEARLDAQFGGAEANVAVALSRLGVPAALVSALPRGAVGNGALDAVRRAGVDTSRVLRGDGRLGLYFLTPGAGLRTSEIVYDRLHSLFATTPSESYNWPVLLSGVSWLHLSGIIPAIGAEAAQLSTDAINAAAVAGVRVSFDSNFRASMWSRWCDDPGQILARHVEGADLLFGSHRDVSLMLDAQFSGDRPEQRREAVEAAFARFPRLATIASTTRRVLGTDHHRLSARVDGRDDFFETAEIDVTGIVDRIGTGDAFASGVLAGLDDGCEAAATMGLSLAALAHATPGDQSMTTRDDLAAFRTAVRDVRR